MIRLLPFILVPILILAGLGYWRYQTSKTGLATPQESEQDQQLMEVPKTLPNATLEDRVKVLEDLVVKLVTSVNSLKSQISPVNTSPSDSRLSDLEAAATELKARVSALEKATSAPAASSGKSTVYIPLGAGGSWTDIDWLILTEYEVSLNPDNYLGYSGMNLEVNFRLAEPSGTGSVRLYNVTDNTAISSQVDTTSSNFTLFSTSSFKLPAGTKIYRLQVKSTDRKELHIQSARIKVNF
ncbi:hypothetical protein KKE03_01115 [Patescibacteria group bacterium]|nr:hypothetical protein [Patescibacteria group bacterium]